MPTRHRLEMEAMDWCIPSRELRCIMQAVVVVVQLVLEVLERVVLEEAVQAVQILHFHL